MNKRSGTLIILAVIAVIIAVILIDFTSSKPGKRGANPYEYNIEELKAVDSSLIHYREIRNIKLDKHPALGFDIYNDELYITGEQFLQVLSPSGVQKLFIPLEDTGTCIKVTADHIFVGFEDHVGKFDKKGKLIQRWDDLGRRAVITSISAGENRVYVADAGNRRVCIYDNVGRMIGEFGGKSESAAGNGFIVPSPNFDLLVNNYGDLWVVNPGVHALENYTVDGELRSYWQKRSTGTEGFIGCCNPAEIALLGDGSFVTSEKGMVRIKVYDESGELISVVAPPSKFKDQGKAPEVATDSHGLIYALDFDRSLIRIFEKN